MSQNSKAAVWVAYVRRYYRPALIAWLLQRGISSLVVGVRDPLADRVIVSINLFIRNSMADTVELGRLSFPWWAPLVNAAGGMLVASLALALGYSLLDSARHSKTCGEKIKAPAETGA